MAGKPHVRVRIDFRDVSVQFDRSSVVTVLLLQGLDQAGLVACKRIGVAIADLLPQVLTTLTTATAEEKVVVDFVVRCRFLSIKHCSRCAFQADDDRGVVLVCKYMTSESICLPTERLRFVKPSVRILPITLSRLLHICIRRHLRHAYHRLLVPNVRPIQLIQRPCR